MPEAKHDPKSLLAVTNLESRALMPSEANQPEFIKWAHDHGAHLYLVLVGPRTEIVGLEKDVAYWKVRTHFHDGTLMKPRMIPVPFDILPEKGTKLSGGTVDWVDCSGASHRSNAVDIVRRVLRQEWESKAKLDDWHLDTLKKFFTYHVEYIGQSFGKDGERTAAERISQGHKTVQKILAEVCDLNPNGAVAFLVLDSEVQGSEVEVSLGPDNVQDASAAMARTMAKP